MQLPAMTLLLPLAITVLVCVPVLFVALGRSFSPVDVGRAGTIAGPGRPPGALVGPTRSEPPAPGRERPQANHAGQARLMAASERQPASPAPVEPAAGSEPAPTREPAGRDSSDQGSSRSGSTRTVAEAVERTLAARAAAASRAAADAAAGPAHQGRPGPRPDGAPAGSAGVMAAAVELGACRVRLDHLSSAMGRERAVLGDVLRRLSATGLHAEQLAQLAGLPVDEVRQLLFTPVDALRR